MDTRKAHTTSHWRAGGGPATQMQPSQANISGYGSRVRNAQALKDERAYIKAQEEGAPSDQLYRLRRRALPGIPCLDCGSRMKCEACDKTELLEKLMEDYVNPPAKFEKGIQADVLADMAAEAATEDEEDKGPTQEEILSQQLRESQQREEFLRNRIKNKMSDYEELERKYELQTEELQVRTQQRDDFEERWKKAEEDLAQLHVDMAQMKQNFEDLLVHKEREMHCIQIKRVHQHHVMEKWLDSKAGHTDIHSVMNEWIWHVRTEKVHRAWQQTLNEKEEEMQRMKNMYEQKLEEAQARYDALESAAAKKQEELEGIIAERDATISSLRAELALSRAEHQTLIVTFSTEKARLEKELDGWKKKHEDIHIELLTEKDERERQEEIAQDVLREKQLEEERERERIAAIRQGMGLASGSDGLPSIDADRYVIKDLENRLQQAEEEYNVMTVFLDKCQQKVLDLRRRLHAEVQHQLDSQAKYHNLNKEKSELELKLMAQRRCMSRQRIPKAEVHCRALCIKNDKLMRHIDSLQGRLGEVRNIASRSSDRDVRWAITRAAGKEDLKARRTVLLESLQDPGGVPRRTL